MLKKTKLPPGPEDVRSLFQPYAFDPSLRKKKLKFDWVEGPPSIVGSLKVPSAQDLRRILQQQDNLEES